MSNKNKWISFFNNPISNWLDDQAFWINPVLTIIIGLSGAATTYILPSETLTSHPTIRGMLTWLLDYEWIFLFFSLVILALITAIKCKNQKTINKLEKELSEEQEKNSLIGDNIKKLFDGYLYQLSNELIPSDSNKDRITLYVHHENKFIPCGRYSRNNNYRKAGRDTYPENEGCIAVAWNDGWIYDDKIPEDPEKRYKYFKAKYGINKEVSKKLSMQSLFYAGIKLSCKNGDNHAVIILESLVPQKYSEDKVSECLEKQKDYVTELVTKLKPHIPLPQNAKSVGL